MFGIGGFELFIILLFGFLIFGPDKLPAMAKTIGRAIAKFRNAQEDMTEQLKGQSFMDKDSDEPFKNPLDVIENAANEAQSSTAAARAKADEAVEKITEKTESFAERKARYDKERAERKAAEKKAAQEAAEQAEAEEAARKEARENPKADVAPRSVAEAADDGGCSSDLEASDPEVAGGDA